MKSDIIYSGQKLQWKGIGTFKATSGFADDLYVSKTVDFTTKTQSGRTVTGKSRIVTLCRYERRDWDYTDAKGEGPIPEGWYYILLVEDARIYAKVVGKGDSTTMVASWKLQRIPFKKGQNFTNSWGNNRIRLTPYKSTKTLSRGGFYLHDSTKGYTHGCIETEKRFFDLLRKYISVNKLEKKNRRSRLNIQVRYDKSNIYTWGGTSRKETAPGTSPWKDCDEYGDEWDFSSSPYTDSVP